MRVNPVHEKIMYGDKLHIFTTSKQFAQVCLQVLEDDSVLDSVVNKQRILF